MRHYAEATAMALLLSHRQLNSFHALERDRRFPVQDELNIVPRKRNAELLGINRQG
jgi:hypothetical protein